MSTVSPPIVLAAGVPPSGPRLSIDQYHEMIQRGQLTGDDRVELLDGMVVAKMPKSPRHRVANRRLRDLLESLLPAGWHVESQEPVTLASSEPEPDIAVIRGMPDDFVKRHPGPGDIGMIAEVADTSLSRDRGQKGRIYAESGIAAYWVVNLVEMQVEVYTGPIPGSVDYPAPAIYRGDEAVPVVLERAEIGRITAKDLLPEAS